MLRYIEIEQPEYVIASNEKTAQSIAQKIASGEWDRLYTSYEDAEDALSQYSPVLRKLYRVFTVRVKKSIAQIGTYENA